MSAFPPKALYFSSVPSGEQQIPTAKAKWRYLMATSNPTEGLHASGWYIGMAILFILLGLTAIIEPGVAGWAITLLVGWLLIFGGVAHLVVAFRIADFDVGQKSPDVGNQHTV
jgi:Short repeat of unknown function (DUF308)